MGQFNFKDFDALGDYWTKFEGDFKDGMKSGYGILYLTNSEKFACTFVNDKATGYGTFYRKDGITISGYWESNKLQRNL